MSTTEIAFELEQLEPADRRSVASGLRMWFLLAADAKLETASWLSDQLRWIDAASGLPAECCEWADKMRTAVNRYQRELNGQPHLSPDEIKVVCERAEPWIEQLPPELLWGLGCFRQRCSEDDGGQFLRLVQCHYMDSFLINRELAKLERRSAGLMRYSPSLTGALAVHTDYQLSIQYAGLLLATGRPAAFEIIRDRCFRRYPDDSLVFSDWGDFLAMHRKFDEALVAYDRAIELGFPHPQFPLTRMGQIFERWGLPSVAQDLYQQALAVEDLPDAQIEELEQAIAGLSHASN